MPKTILVLEDEPQLYELLSDLLGFEGYQVRKPADIGGLVEELKASPPDAVLMDVNLKGANGLDLLGKIRADSALQKLVVLLSSGLDYQQEALERGADAFLLKPYMPAELIKALNDNLG
jgi:DNA-binding response OmpR family regulator